MKGIIFISALFCILLSGCTMDHTKSTKTGEFEFHGLLKQQGFTTYQYGTHVISDGSKTYALKSSTVNLDAYTGKNVTITGTMVDGYPVENGPGFIDVKAVK